MHMRLRVALTALLALLAPIAARAQDNGQFGLTMGYPTSVGFIWHATDRIALRPEFTMSRSWMDAERETIESSSWTLGAGIGVVFYLTKRDNLRTYFSPRYAYSRSTTTSASTEFFLPLENRLRTNNSSVVGLFGAQYALSPRFSAFGEVGVGYGRQSFRSQFTRFTSHSVNTRGGAGVILYF